MYLRWSRGALYWFCHASVWLFIVGLYITDAMPRQMASNIHQSGRLMFSFFFNSGMVREVWPANGLQEILPGVIILQYVHTSVQVFVTECFVQWSVTHRVQSQTSPNIIMCTEPHCRLNTLFFLKKDLFFFLSFVVPWGTRQIVSFLMQLPYL